MGGASRWWLHHALESLNTSLDGKLQLYRGEPLAILSQLASDTSAQGVYWNRCYEPWRIDRDGEIKTALKAADIEVQSFNGSLLWEPWQVLKKDQTPYKVFTPYYRRGCLSKVSPRKPLAAPNSVRSLNLSEDSLPLKQLELKLISPVDIRSVNSKIS